MARARDVHRHDVQQQVTVDRRRFDLDVVDAHDLAPVDVDDLLIEQIAFEEQHAVRRDEALHAACRSRRAPTRRRM